MKPMPPPLVVAKPSHGELATKLPDTLLTGRPSKLLRVIVVPLAVKTAQWPSLVPAIQTPSVCALVRVACCAPTTRPTPSPPTRKSFRSISSTFWPAELKPIAVPTLAVPSITWNRPLPSDTSVPLRPRDGQGPVPRSAPGHDDHVLLPAITNVPMSVTHAAVRQPRCMKLYEAASAPT